MNHVPIMPYSLQSVLSASSRQIFAQLGELSENPFAFTTQPGEVRTCAGSHGLDVTPMDRRVSDPGACVSKPQAVLTISEATVCTWEVVFYLDLYSACHLLVVFMDRLLGF